MSAWPEEVIATKQIKDYIDLERRAAEVLHRHTILDSNLKNEYFTGNAPANHTNGIFSPGSMWFVVTED